MMEKDVEQDEQGEGADWLFRIYIAGITPKSVRALENLKRLCEDLLDGNYRIEVVDLLKHPDRASMDQILAIPTVVRKTPDPEHKVIGDLSDRNRVVAGLGIESPGGGTGGRGAREEREERDGGGDAG